MSSGWPFFTRKLVKKNGHPELIREQGQLSRENKISLPSLINMTLSHKIDGFMSENANCEKFYQIRVTE